MNKRRSDVLKTLLGGLRVNWRTLLSIHFAYAALGLILLAPLTGAVTRLLVGLSGQAALADQDILYFVLTPLGMASLVLIAAILVAIMALEQASMMAAASGLAAPNGNRTLDALRFAAARAPRILVFGLWLVARLLLIAVPFLLLGAAVAWALLTDYDINYYLQTRPLAFWLAAGLIGLVLAALSVLLVHRLLAWSLALPLVLFLSVPPTRSLGESARLTFGHRGPILRIMLGWALVVLGLGALASGLVGILGHWIAPPFFDSLPMLVIVLGGLVSLWALANLLVAGLSAGTFALAILSFAKRLAPGIETAAHARESGVRRPQGWRRTAWRLTTVLIGGAVLAALTGVWLIDGVAVRDDVTIVAHRGAAGKAPENTLASVNQAIEDRTDWVEIDVQESADGDVIVMHDSDFMKLAGVDLKIWDATLSEIKRIDVGSWLAPEFAGERVPTLREVLDAARGRAGVVIELKYYGYDQDLERRVMEVVEAADMVEHVAIMSLKYEGIQKMRALRPDWTIGLLSATGIGDLTQLDADFLSVNMDMATPRFVRDAQAAGKRVFVWTVNDPVSMSRMMSIGVDGIITDEPEMAREVLNERFDLNPVERLLVHTTILLGEPAPPRIYRDNSP